MSGLSTHGSTIKIQHKQFPPSQIPNPTNAIACPPLVFSEGSKSSQCVQFMLQANKHMYEKNGFSTYDLMWVRKNQNGLDWWKHDRSAGTSGWNFHSPPPSKTTTGPLSSCLLKRNQKNTIWRKGSSHYLTTCTMSPTFSTRPYRTNPRLAKDSPLNFHSPPSKTTTGPLSSCLLKRNQTNTICTTSPTFFNWSMQEKSKTCQRFTSCTFLSMEHVDPY